MAISSRVNSFLSILAATILSMMPFTVLQPLSAQQFEDLPEVSFSDLRVESQQADRMSGFYTVRNGSSMAISAINCNVSIVHSPGRTGAEQAENHVKGFEILQNISQEVSLAGGEEKQIPFSFKPSPALGGADLSLRAEAYSMSGINMASRSIPLTIEAPSFKVGVTRSWITVAGREFPLQAGPVVPAGQKPKLHILLTNSGKGTNLIPEVTVHKSTFTREPLVRRTEKTVSMRQGLNEELVLELPIPEKPGVYEAAVRLVDAHGNQMVPLILARYILEGDIITIHRLSLDKVSVSPGEAVRVEVVASGPPLNIATGQRQKIGPVETLIQLLDKQGNAAGAATVPVWWDRGIIRFDSIVTATTSIPQLRVRLQVSRDGKVIMSSEAGASLRGM